MLGLYSGNEMLVRGALEAGCRFFAGYPISPATPILVGMLRELPQWDGVGIEAEDEIAAIGFCIGASLAGSKAMTATSGPGISLYSENIGLAIAAEVPLVIVDVQRQGPATGSATQTSQGDVQFIRWVTSGGMPAVALCPTTAAECYTLTIEAFNLAERLRAPVFLLSDKEVAMTKERVDLETLEAPAVEERTLAPGGQEETYRFGEPQDVPAMTLFDGTGLARYTTSTHDERAYLTSDAETIQRFIDHLERKISDRAEELERVCWDPQEGSPDLMVSYGSTARSAREAVQSAREGGRQISHLVIHSVWPLPERALVRALEGVERVIVPEMNLGLYRREIERAVGGRAEVVGVNRMDTKLITPEQILEEAGLV
ncbi:MAG: pyruvate flavodoxin/ferredoxin oxidoreductase [Acidobacteriota bacterium]